MKKTFHYFALGIFLLASLTSFKTQAQDCGGNQHAFITNTISGDTGELRFRFPDAVPAGTMTATINKGVSVNDAFVNLSGTSTSRANAAIDIRIDDAGSDSDIEGFSFTQSGETQNATANFPAFTNDTDYDVEVSWDATGSSTMITVYIDGQLVAGPFASEADDQSAIADGVQVVQFRFGFNSDVETNGAGLFVDDLVVSDPSGAVLFSDDYESYAWGESLDSSDNANSVYNDNTTDASVYCDGAGVDDEEEEEEEEEEGNCVGDHSAFITDNGDDTGELRFSFPDAVPSGTMIATISKASGFDAFVNISGTSTTRRNALIDIRVKDSGYSFTESGANVDPTNFPAFAVDTEAVVELSWEAQGPGQAPLITVIIDGQMVADQFATGSEDVTTVEEGLRTVQFRYAGSSDVEMNGAGFTVDDITVTDDTGVVLYTQDFEGFEDGVSLDPDINPESPYHENSEYVTVACVPGDEEGEECEGDNSGFVTDLNDSDTGELRFSFSDAVPSGTMTATILKNAGFDAFVNISGTSTSRSNAMIDIRVKDSGYSFTESGANVDPTNFPAFAVDTEATVEISWESQGPGQNPLITVSIDGQQVADQFVSEAGDVTTVEEGLRTVQFRYASNSDVEMNGAGLFVDDIVVTDDNGTILFSEDFEGFEEGDSLDPDSNPASPFHSNSSDVTVTCDGDEGGEDEECEGDIAGFVTDLNESDTGELRFSFGDPVPAGTMTATIIKNAGFDAFVNISGTSTSRSNAMIDMRVKDSGYSFTESGASVDPTNFPAFALDTEATVEISWETQGPGQNPLITVMIDGQQVADQFVSEAGDVTTVEEGLRTVQFRYASNSDVEMNGAGLFVDDIVITDPSGTVLFSEDFEGFGQGDLLDPDLNPGSPFHENSSDATAECDDTGGEVDPCDGFVAEFFVLGGGEVCPGETTELIAEGNYDSVLWSTGETTPSIIVGAGEFSATATFDCDYNIIFQEFVTINEIPTNSTTESAFICDGETVEINGVTYDTAGTFFQDVLNPVTGCIDELIVIIDSGSNEATTVDDIFCEGDEYIFNGEVFTEGGTFEFPMMTSQGCDSLVTLVLTQIDVVTTTQTETICNGESVEVNGVTYDTAGEFTQTITSGAGCDDLLVITIIVNDTPETILSDSFCEGEEFIFNGEVFTEPGAYVFDLMTVAGCDSTVILSLEEIAAPSESTSAQICEGSSVEVNGVIYDAPGTFTQDITDSVTGCTGTLTVSIEQVDIIEVALSDGICPGGSIIFEGEEITSAGSFQFDFISVAGCDSIVVLTVEELEESATTNTATIVPGETIIVEGEEVSAPGTFTTVLTNAVGCDSIVTTIVTVDSSVSQGIVAFGFDECTLANEGFEEFEPTFPSSLDCITDIQSMIYRNNPATNGHSCTEGLDGTTTMCISAYDGCTPNFGSSRVLFFETQYATTGSGSVALASVDFSHIAPETFVFTNGGSGDNNYPTLFGYRVLNNGVVIAEETGLETSQDWVDFSIDLSEFALAETGTLTVEFLPYCPVDIDSPISAWDIENLTLNASCNEPRMTVYGEITDRSNHLMPDININITEHPVSTTNITTIGGTYEYSTDSELLIIEPTHDIDPLDGVSTLDILMIQLHLLNIRSFESNLDYVAADANNSKNVTTHDIVDIRNVILGKTDAYPNNTSWRFHLEDGTISQNSEYSINEQFGTIVKGNHEVNFTGIKVGDVNNSVVTYRSAEDIDITYTVVNNQIALHVEDDIDLMGLQLALNVNDATIESIDTNLDQFSEENYEIVNGTLNVSWHTSACTTIAKDAPFFYINLASDLSRTASLEIAEGGNYSEYYDCELSTIGINLNNAADVQPTSEVTIVSVSPNPVENTLNITISDQFANDAVSAQLLDLEGKTILGQTEIDLSRGIDVSAMHPGLYILKVTNGTVTQHQKVLKL